MARTTTSQSKTSALHSIDNCNRVVNYAGWDIDVITEAGSFPQDDRRGGIWIPRGSAVLPGMELMGCPELAVPAEVMDHVVRVESSYNPFAIGVVGGRLARQPRNLPEAVATARMLEDQGYNFSLGLAQVNRYNLGKYGLDSYEKAFDTCPNLMAGSRILAECNRRAGGDWGKSFSCYYSGNFVTGYRHGYVQKVYASMGAAAPAIAPAALAINVVGKPSRRTAVATRASAPATSQPSAQAMVQARISMPPVTSTSVHGDTLPARLPAPHMGGAAVAVAPYAQAQMQPANVATAQSPPPPAVDAAFVF